MGTAGIERRRILSGLCDKVARSEGRGPRRRSQIPPGVVPSVPISIGEPKPVQRWCLKKAGVSPMQQLRSDRFLYIGHFVLPGGRNAFHKTLGKTLHQGIFG
jgi:hypothetical protein